MRKMGARGFSLMEVMIAIAIGAVIAGAATLSFTKAGYKGKVARVKTDLKAIEGALHQFESDNGTFPQAEKGLQALIDEGYLNKKAVPKDPWGNTYVYVVPGPGNLPFDVISYGEGGEEGGEAKKQDIKLSEME
ncbi:MAG: type II secretion system protein GspG [Deltaproteobacteria bacterium]|nr:type II secretion system protein GspG [Deltaproteobacteria bacterium]